MLLKFKLKSFTLIELLIVVTIIGLISTVVFVTVPSLRFKAKDAKITENFHQLLNLAEKINLDKGNYDSLCEGEVPCNEGLQEIYEDIEKNKGALIIQKPETPSQSYCAFSPLNIPSEDGQTQYYCIDSTGIKIKTLVNPGQTLCTNDSFNCPSQFAYGEGEGDFIIPPLGGAASIFTVSTKKYPYFKEVTIDPLDVRVGDIQTMLVDIEDPNGINWIKADIEHDHGTDTVMLVLAEGTQEQGIWGGQWKVHDTHNTTYHTTFTAQNRKAQQNSITLAWTDPCSPPVSGGWTLDSSCALDTDEVNGLEAGDFTVPEGYTITIAEGATWVFNSGYSIKLTGGSIVISKTGVGGQIKKSNLWMIDADSDGYASSSASSQYYGITAPVVNGVTAVRRSTMTDYAALDYNDRNASIYYNTSCGSGSATGVADSYSDTSKVAATSSIEVDTGSGQLNLEAGS